MISGCEGWEMLMREERERERDKGKKSVWHTFSLRPLLLLFLAGGGGGGGGLSSETRLVSDVSLSLSLSACRLYHDSP